MRRTIVLLWVLALVACAGQEEASEQGAAESAPADAAVADTLQADTIMARDTAGVP
jgi:hypothetical protein